MKQTMGWSLNGYALNENAMEIFTYSINKDELIEAAGWMKKYFDKNPKEFESDGSAIDTYAILLYKAGKVDEAIILEERAHKIAPNEKDFIINLAKMKQGLKIWPEGYDPI